MRVSGYDTILQNVFSAAVPTALEMRLHLEPLGCFRYIALAEVCRMICLPRSSQMDYEGQATLLIFIFYR